MAITSISNGKINATFTSIFRTTFSHSGQLERRRVDHGIMTTIKIRTESLPKRCEVCHQSDRFNAKENHCARCANMLASRNVEIITNTVGININGLIALPTTTALALFWIEQLF